MSLVSAVNRSSASRLRGHINAGLYTGSCRSEPKKNTDAARFCGETPAVAGRNSRISGAAVSAAPQLCAPDSSSKADRLLNALPSDATNALSPILVREVAREPVFFECDRPAKLATAATSGR